MFEHLKKYDIHGKQEWMSMPELGPKARLLLAPAGEANPPYYNALIRKLGKRSGKRSVSVEDLKEHRENDRHLYPLYVLKSWEGVFDQDGNEVPYSREMAKELCQALPPELFDRLRNFAAASENFMPEDEEPLPDPEELAGN